MRIAYGNVVAWFEKFVENMLKDKKRVAAVIGGIIILSLAFTGFFYYRGWIQTRAHRDFMKALIVFDAPVSSSSKSVTEGESISFASGEEKWKKVEEVFRKGYEQNSSAGIAPMYKVMQSDALTQLGKIENAILLLADAVKSIPSRELKDFYELKLALLKFDSKHPATQQEGLKKLKAISQDSQHLANEAGLYYLGYYFWGQKDYANARNYWQQLMVKYGMKESKESSGFASLAKPKLKLISAEW